MDDLETVENICDMIDSCDDPNSFSNNFNIWYKRLIVPIEKLAKNPNSNSNSTLIPRAAVLAFCRVLPLAAEFPDIARQLNASGIHHLVQTLVQCPRWFDQWSLLGLNTCMTYFRYGCRKNFAKIILPFVSRCAADCCRRGQTTKTSSVALRRQIAYSIAQFPRMAAGNAAVGCQMWSQQVKNVLLDIHEILLLLMQPLTTHDDERCRLSATLKTDDGHVSDAVCCGDLVATPQFFIQLFPGENLAVAAAALTNKQRDKRNTETKFLKQRAALLLDVLRLMFSAESYDRQNIIIPTVNVAEFTELFACLGSLIEKLKMIKQDYYDLVSQFAAFIGTELLPAIGILAAPFASSMLDSALRLINLSFTRSYEVNSGLFDLLTGLAEYVGPASLQTFQRLASKAVPITERVLLPQGDRVAASKNTSNSASSEIASSGGRGGSRKRRKATESVAEEIATTGRRSPNLDVLVTACCLTWRAILRSGGAFVRPNDFRQLQQIVCRVLMRGYHRSSSSSISMMKSADSVVSSAVCRREIYDLLGALVACPHPFRPSVVQCAVGIFETGLRRDDDADVVAACRMGLSTCALVAKPQAPYLESVTAAEAAATTAVEEEQQEAAEMLQSADFSSSFVVEKEQPQPPESAVQEDEEKEEPPAKKMMAADQASANAAKPSTNPVQRNSAEEEIKNILQTISSATSKITTTTRAETNADVVVTIEDDEDDEIEEIPSRIDDDKETAAAEPAESLERRPSTNAASGIFEMQAENKAADVASLIAGFVDAPAEDQQQEEISID